MRLGEDKYKYSVLFQIIGRIVSIKDMKEKNKLYYEGTRDGLIDQGYIHCKRCNP